MGNPNPAVEIGTVTVNGAVVALVKRCGPKTVTGAPSKLAGAGSAVLNAGASTFDPSPHELANSERINAGAAMRAKLEKLEARMGRVCCR